MTNQFLKDLEPFVVIDENGNKVVKEDDLTALMCSHALTPDGMGRVHEALELHRIEILPYENDGDSLLCRKMLQAIEKASNILDVSTDSMNMQQKEKVILSAKRLSSKLLCFVGAERSDAAECAIGQPISSTLSFDTTADKAYTPKGGKRAAGFINKGLIVDVLEYLESIHHNASGYTPQEMLDVIISRGIDVSMSKDPHANLRGALPMLVSKELYPEYVKARLEDIVYQPSGKYTGTWRLSKYRT